LRSGRRRRARTAFCCCRTISSRRSRKGLYRHIVAICGAVGIGVIVYHRERLQRKELSGTSGRAKASGIVTDEIVDVLPVPVWRKRAIIGEMGDREGQQTRPDDFKR
jgi:hypothetical protein